MKRRIANPSATQQPEASFARDGGRLDDIALSIEIQRQRDLAQTKGEAIPSVDDLARRIEIRGLRTPREGQLSWTLDELMRVPVRPQNWIIDRLLGPGVTLFGGKQKGGKTIFAMQALTAVAAGREFLGRRTQQMGVLYLSYDEQDETVLKQQTRPFFQPNIPFQIECDWPLLDEGGVGTLVQVLRSNPIIGTVAIDTFQSALKTRIGSDYSRNYALVNDLTRTILEETGRPIAVLLLHHLTKVQRSPEWDQQMYGSNGLAAAARSIWHIAKAAPATPEEGPYVFHAKGRTMREQELRLMRSLHVFHAKDRQPTSGESDAFSWMIDPAASSQDSQRNPTDSSIIRVLQTAPPAGLREVDIVSAVQSPHKRQYVSARLHHLVGAGVILKHGYPRRWKYRLRGNAAEAGRVEKQSPREPHPSARMTLRKRGEASTTQ